MKNVIYLIEDFVDNAKLICEKLNSVAKVKNTEECQFEFMWLKGKNKGEMGPHKCLFYDESVLQQLQECIDNIPENARMCLMLDVMLVADDYNNDISGEHGKADLAKSIYLKYRGKIPIYLITSAPWFGTKSDVVMGVDLSEQFITKNAILKYEIKEDIDNLFMFYQNENIINA